jgi:hypothetical protein
LPANTGRIELIPVPKVYGAEMEFSLILSAEDILPAAPVVAGVILSKGVFPPVVANGEVTVIFVTANPEVDWYAAYNGKLFWKFKVLTLANPSDPDKELSNLIRICEPVVAKETVCRSEKFIACAI